MNDKPKGKFNVGVDLGTSNLLIYVEGRGTVFNEPSVIAIDKATNKVVAAGADAHQMLGKVHSKISVVKPLKNGVISDMKAAKALVSYVLKKVENLTEKELSNTSSVICCPSEVTQIERDAMIDLAHNLGVPDVFIEEEVKAGGIGAGLDIYSSNGSMVIDIGGGSTDIGVLSLGDIVVSDSIRVAGNFFDQEIINYLQYEHGLLIGKKTAQRIKEEIGTLREKIVDEKVTLAKGRDIVSGLPRKLEITQTEVRDVMLEPFNNIATAILKVLQNTPAELSADIIVNGMLITGGCALIDGVDEFLEKTIGLDIHIAKNPLTAIVEGTKVLLQNRGNYYVKPVD